MASGTLYFGTTQYGAQYAVDYSYTSSTFTIDSVKVKLAQYASVWWAFNLTVKINNTTVGGSGGNKFIDTFDWYDLGISGSASASGEVTISLTGSAIHNSYQFNVASPTSQTVNTGSSSGSGDGDSGGGDILIDPSTPIYLWVLDTDGVKIVVDRVFTSAGNKQYGSYTGILTHDVLDEDEDGVWFGYRIWYMDIFKITVTAIEGYEIIPGEGKVDGLSYYEYIYGHENVFVYEKSYGSEPYISVAVKISAIVHLDNGTTFEPYQVYIDNGTSWDLVIPYIDTGTTWEPL